MVNFYYPVIIPYITKYVLNFLNIKNKDYSSKLILGLNRWKPLQAVEMMKLYCG